ncbi:MAG: ferrous iron transport protein B [Zestosphaera tikiterensis]|uniref:Ferrous iron transport protein B n=1 Tax=Zestosphaera tikiterensis TaxID=1973259 RepID=A0A2R7Y5T3_9CREN|nr:MAG: ferrous iron transport protein B [Zestosphaera tikiterensis]
MSHKHCGGAGDVNVAAKVNLNEADRGCDVKVALVGNPNVGKSTLFNVLTGENVRVGNWPGTTVGFKEGELNYGGVNICFTDLPGIYGLSALSLEEVIAREYIISNKPDVVLVLVDSLLPERTMYLAIQMLEITPNVIIVLTKSDEAHKRGIHIHYDKLEERLGVPVIPISALRKEGIRELLNAIIGFKSRVKRREPIAIDYGPLNNFINELSTYVSSSKALSKYPVRWATIRLLEGDYRLEELLIQYNEKEVLKKAQELREIARITLGRPPQELSISARYGYVDALLKEVVVRVEVRNRGELIVKKVFMNPLTGIPASIAILLVAFTLIFSLNTGFPLNFILRYLGFYEAADLIESLSLSGVIGAASEIALNQVKEFLEETLHLNPAITSFITDGALTGFTTLLSFIPLITFTFVVLAVLEDSGLEPRIAVSFHTIFSKFGLSGRAIYPYLIGFGCNVPAILTSRTALDDEERRQLIYTSAFIPCQARLIVILAFISALAIESPLYQALTVVSAYVLGISVALITSLMLRKLLYRKESPEFVLELPPLHKPSLKVVWWLTWDNLKHFLRKAGLIIVSVTAFFWFLTYLGPEGFLPAIYGDEFFTHSYAYILGSYIAIPLKPIIGYHENAVKLGTALLAGFIAKEALLTTLAQIQGTDPITAIRSLNLTYGQALSIMYFTILYVPCIATLATILSEGRNAKATLALTAYMVSIGYAVMLLTSFIFSITTG